MEHNGVDRPAVSCGLQSDFGASKQWYNGNGIPPVYHQFQFEYGQVTYNYDKSATNTFSFICCHLHSQKDLIQKSLHKWQNSNLGDTGAWQPCIYIGI